MDTAMELEMELGECMDIINTKPVLIEIGSVWFPRNTSQSVKIAKNISNLIIEIEHKLKISLLITSFHSSSEKGGVHLMNPHIQDMEEDVLYHLSLGSGSHDLEQMFGDVKFVCMGGTPRWVLSYLSPMVWVSPLPVYYCMR